MGQLDREFQRGEQRVRSVFRVRSALPTRGRDSLRPRGIE